VTTKHTHRVAWGHRVEGCPRCAELDAGAAPVPGWGDARYDGRRSPEWLRRQADKMREVRVASDLALRRGASPGQQYWEVVPFGPFATAAAALDAERERDGDGWIVTTPDGQVWWVRHFRRDSERERAH